MENLEIVIIALVFNFMDIITGVIGAVKNNELKSKSLRDGLFKKLAFIICYFLAWFIDVEGCKVGFDIGINLLPTVIGYVVFTEIVSIAENISIINPDILPEKLLSLLNINQENKE